MKNVFIILIISLLFFSCSKSSIKYLQKGQYDNAIDKSVKELLKDPQNNEESEVLKKAYALANQRDNQKIDQLRMSGQPDIWNAVYNTYSLLQKRQEKVAALNQSILNYIGYQYVNYNNEIAEAKKKAAEYFYVHAKKLLESKDRFDARIAYDELQKIKSIFSNYKDTDDLLKTAYNIGNSYVLFSIINNSQSILPLSFEKELFKTSVGEMNQKWIIFHSKAVDNFYYDYYIRLNIRMIDISPESLNQNHYTDTKEVADGWRYLLDANGNVKKDSLGNDIKIPKTKIISCKVTEIQQYKACAISGNLEFINNETNQIIKSEPVRAEWFFKNFYATTMGDLSALSQESTQKLQSTFKPFPANGDMIMQTGNILKNMTKDIIKRNANLLK